MQQWLHRLRWPRRILRVVLVVVFARSWMRTRHQREPCPYSRRLCVQLPHPFITRRRLFEVLRPQAGETILEIGPGTGYYSLSLTRKVQPGGIVHLLDVQMQMLRHTLEHASNAGLDQMPSVQADAMRLPYRDGAFDTALLVTVLGEIPDEAQALAELRRVLKPGGRMTVGEVVLDPHFVRLSDARRRAEEAGFHLDKTSGPPFGYFARFTL